MKQLICSIILFYCLSISVFSQDTLGKKKSLYFELAGSGGLGSLNYERELFTKKNTEFTLRLGYSIAPVDKNNGFGNVFPFLFNSLIGKSAHKLEVGLGQAFTITTKGNFFIMGNAVLGYRYQHPEKKWFYRISYTPIISYLINFQLQNWAGLSIGYTFNKKTK
jgi:hypothetical protein